MALFGTTPIAGQFGSVEYLMSTNDINAGIDGPNSVTVTLWEMEPRVTFGRVTPLSARYNEWLPSHIDYDIIIRGNNVRGLSGADPLAEPTLYPLRVSLWLDDPALTGETYGMMMRGHCQIERFRVRTSVNDVSMYEIKLKGTPNDGSLNNTNRQEDSFFIYGGATAAT